MLLFMSVRARPAGNVSMNAATEQATIQFPSAVKGYTDKVTLGLNFTYPLSEGLSGFYRSTPSGGSHFVVQISCIWGRHACGQLAVMLGRLNVQSATKYTK